jgi:hypothetical protein
MKIIGKTDDGFIVDMTQDELANIAGGSCSFSNIESDYDGEIKERQVSTLKTETKIDVNRLYNRARCLTDEWASMKSSILSFKGQCTKFQNMVNDK